LQPGYKIDYDTLDFHWEPYDRKGLNSKTAITILPLEGKIVGDGVVHSGDGEEKIQLPITNQTPFPEGSASPQPFRFCIGGDTTKPSNESQNSPENRNTLEPEPHHAPAFAPAPGIFISPLRNDANFKCATDNTTALDATSLVRLTILHYSVNLNI
jgi:hypothetical protein